MQLLIDADLVAYRCAASVEPSTKAEPRTLTEEETKLEQEIAIARCDTLMRELLHTTQADQYQAFLTGPNNFRKQVNPEYKANRKDTLPPRFLQQCRYFLVSEWNAVVSDGCEADDLLGIAQCTAKKEYENTFFSPNWESTILASLDKDLLMIPGQHYNWVKDESKFVDEIDGIKHMYKQALIGDRADNIFGVDKIGVVKAARIIDHLETELEMIEAVRALYEDDNRLIMNLQCLWIMQEEGVTWAQRVNKLTLPDQFKQEVEAMSDYMTSLMDVTSMGLITNSPKTSGILVNGVVPESMETKQLPLI